MKAGVGAPHQLCPAPAAKVADFLHLPNPNLPHPKSVAFSQCTSISSIRTPGGESYAFLDPNEPKVIASFLIPYKVTRDSKNPGEFKVTLEISKHAILYGSLLQLQVNNQ